MQITRRGALLGASAAAVVAGVPGAVLAAKTATGSACDALTAPGTPATTAAALAPSMAPRREICIIGYSLALYPRGSIDRAKRLSIVVFGFAAT